MRAEIRIKCDKALADAAEIAATRLGLTVSGYVKMALSERLLHDGLHPTQPKAD